MFAWDPSLWISHGTWWTLVVEVHVEVSHLQWVAVIQLYLDEFKLRIFSFFFFNFYFFLTNTLSKNDQRLLREFLPKDTHSVSYGPPISSKLSKVHAVFQ